MDLIIEGTKINNVNELFDYFSTTDYLNNDNYLTSIYIYRGYYKKYLDDNIISLIKLLSIISKKINNSKPNINLVRTYLIKRILRQFDKNASEVLPDNLGSEYYDISPVQIISTMKAIPIHKGLRGLGLFQIPYFTVDSTVKDSTVKDFIIKSNVPFFDNNKKIKIFGLSEIELIKIDIVSKRGMIILGVFDPAYNEAKIYFEKLGCPLKSYRATKVSLDDLCNQILIKDNQSGFIIGEAHQDYNSKIFLINNMEKMYRMGVRILFLEHFMYNTIMQRDLDSKFDTNIPFFLNYYLNKFKSNYYDFRDLILSAKKNGIRIIGIDIDESYRQKEYRLIVMNYIATKIIKAEKKSYKYVALVGELHLSQVDNGCFGLSETLNIPSVHFNCHDESKNNKNIDEINVKNHKVTGNDGLVRKTVNIGNIDYVFNRKTINSTV
jgi:hypothetical protein